MSRKMLAIATILITLVAFSSIIVSADVATADCTLTAGPDDILIPFGTEIFDDRGPSSLVNSVNIPAGTYVVTLQSYDDHLATNPPKPTQPVEQWVLEINGVATAPISDIPDDVEWLQEVVETNYVVAADATAATAKHLLYPHTDAHPLGPNSLVPTCALLSPVPPPSDGWNKSSLEFQGSTNYDSATGTVSAYLCNVGDGDMIGSVPWELYYASRGNAKNGSIIATGSVGPLAAGECIWIMATSAEGDGNYKFRAEQEPGHPGIGELWSD